MKNFTLLLISVVIAIWLSAIAIIAVQNAEPVALKFLTLQSIALPFGLVLAFSTAAGMVAAAMLIPLLGFSRSRRDQDESAEF